VKKIVIVDDSVTIVNVIKKILSEANYVVETITDSTTFFDGGVQDFNPDLMIIDINMPEHDGFYLLENIKVKKVFPDAKIVMCSTKFFEHDIARAEELGADGFLVKPFNDKQLLEKVDYLIGQ
jgi:DNA-binding response OmpR family regulator